jgi:hypothetical protein
MLLSILGIIDLIGAGLLWFGAGLSNSGWAAFFGLLFLIKGFWSIISAGIEGFWFDVLGWADMITGIFLALIWLGIWFDFEIWFAIPMAAKGIWSLVMDFSY